MFQHRIPREPCRFWYGPLLLIAGKIALCVGFATSLQAAQTPVQPIGNPDSVSLTFVRAFSSADDVRPSHPVLNRTLDIIAGPADPVTHLDALQSPTAITVDSTHRVFVADPGARAVHIFDFPHSKYSRLDDHSDRLHAPVALAVDGQNNLYVVDQSSRTVLVYDSAGKFRHSLGKLRGGESYFDTPAAVATDPATGRVYVCDRQRHMVFVLDARGKIVRRVGNRGGGNQPGEFRYPTQMVVAGGEVFVLDTGNTRIQVLDTTGHFLRAIALAYADRQTGLALDSQFRIYVSDPVLNKIQVFRRDGKALNTFDPSTIKDQNFSRPSGMWADAEHSIYVVDSQSKRVGVFRINEERAGP